MFVNQPQLKEKLNSVAMNLMCNSIYSFTADGEFLEFDVSQEKKTIKEAKVRHITQVNNDVSM